MEESGERLASVHGFDEVFASALEFLHYGWVNGKDRSGREERLQRVRGSHTALFDVLLSLSPLLSFHLCSGCSPAV